MGWRSYIEWGQQKNFTYSEHNQSQMWPRVRRSDKMTARETSGRGENNDLLVTAPSGCVFDRIYGNGRLKTRTNWNFQLECNLTIIYFARQRQGVCVCVSLFITYSLCFFLSSINGRIQINCWWWHSERHFLRNKSIHCLWRYATKYPLYPLLWSPTLLQCQYIAKSRIKKKTRIGG